MNKAITEGLNLMPPPFVDGLDVWSSEDGTPGTVTYATNPAGTLFAADADFGDCLEILTTENPQRLRYMGETPFRPGCYLEVTARIKLISGPGQNIRIAAFPGDAQGNEVVIQNIGPGTVANEYNRIVTARAIIGSGDRTGVDMVWRTEPVYAHIGINIYGSAGAVLRVENISVVDRTEYFYRELLDVVDVVDYGARGDGVFDNSLAFESADAAAAGRVVIIPEGEYFLSKNITMTSPVRFEGTVTMPQNRRLVLRENFDLPTYAEAFGSEQLGLKKGIQALFNFTDHESFDLKGRRVDLTEPLDVAAAVSTITYMGSRRVIRNGAIAASDNGNWNPDVTTRTATYNPANPTTLSNVSNVAGIPVGSLVEGFGVGREVYVRSRNVSAGTLELSEPLARAASSQSYTFTRFKYMLDFSGFEGVRSLILDEIEFDGGTVACGVLMAPEGVWWTFRGCWFVDTGLRCITSHGVACQGLTVEGCEFQSHEGAIDIPARKSVALNTNANDTKIRDNRAINFRHFAIVSGGGNLIAGNHFWQADAQPAGEKTAGLVLSRPYSKSTVVGNYIDTHSIELTNEHSPDALNSSGVEFGGVAITGNIFTIGNAPLWFTYINVVPIGNNQVLSGLQVTSNVFKNIGVTTDRVEKIDTSYGSIDFSKSVDILWEGNSYDLVNVATRSPALVEISSSALDDSWQSRRIIELPFQGFAMGCDAITSQGPIQQAGGATHWGNNYAALRAGGTEDRIFVFWEQPVSGVVNARVRMDIAT